MKIYKDKYGRESEIISPENLTVLTQRAEVCLKEILEVLQKHQCKIESRCYGEERVLVPVNKDGLPYVTEAHVQMFGGWQADSVSGVSIDLDGPTFLDELNRAYLEQKNNG